MRVRLSFLSGALTAATLVVGAVLVPAAPAAGAVAADPYTFRNVEVHGGGFVPGIVFNESRPNLVYARTDIGGAYRWNPSTGRWARPWYERSTLVLPQREADVAEVGEMVARTPLPGQHQRAAFATLAAG